MDVFVQALLIVIGFIMLVKGADYFVDGSSSIAAGFGIPRTRGGGQHFGGIQGECGHNHR